jgi:hypothetical protein
MKEINVQRLGPRSANIEQLKATRSWMDNTAEKHAYMCFPLTLTNGLGWGISFNQDIRAVWDGIEDTNPDHVTILEGSDIVYTGRAHGSLSFVTGLIIKTDENTSILTMPVPNQFIRGMQTFTTIMSTSFYPSDIPIAIKITEPNQEIFIPAGTPVAAILPISLSGLQNDFEMRITEGPMPPEYQEELKKYGDAAQAKNSIGEWSKMYRDAVTYDGSSVGKHETKNIKLRTVTCPVTGATIETAD